MKLEYFENDDLDRETIDLLWKQGVNMDDWDYLLITEDLDEFSKIEEDTDWGTEIRWTPTSWFLDRLLTGCCSNIWYLAQWQGKTVMIGVTYHS